MVTGSLYFSNSTSSGRVEFSATAKRSHIPHNCGMPNQESDWYLQEWMGHFGKIQADLTKDLGWDKARAHFIFHGKQPYKRDLLNEVAAWLGIDPYELLMPPEKALAIRELYRTAERIVQGQVASSLNPDGERFLAGRRATPAKGRQTGTDD